MARRKRPFILLLMAIASGSLAGWLSLRYLRQQTAPLMATEPVRSRVVVAARGLTIGAVVAERDVKFLDWSGGKPPPGFVSNMNEVVGRGLMVPLQENEPILDTKLAAKGAGGGLSVIIEPGMRAFSVAVDQVVGVAGFVLPSSRVDVLLTLMGPAAGGEPATRILMQNVRTLAAGQQIQQDKEGKPKEVPVVTLLVTPEQAETLALAAGQGRIQLALRNTMDTFNVRTNGTRVSALMGRAPSPLPSRRTSIPRSVPNAPASTTVEVYRGGQRTLEKFTP